jgi:hypothetical protein
VLGNAPPPDAAGDAIVLGPWEARVYRRSRRPADAAQSG